MQHSVNTTFRSHVEETEKKGLPERSSKSRRVFRSRIRKCPQIEEQLSSHVQGRRHHGFAISTHMVQLKATQKEKELQIPNEYIKACREWLRRFTSRHELSSHKKT